MEAPIAQKKPTSLMIHEHSRQDDYFWFRDREDPEVIAYLESENAYTQEQMAHTKDLQETLYQEIIGRIKQTDMSVPYTYNGYSYYTRYEEGQEYPIYCRKKTLNEENGHAEEEVMLDVNAMAEGHNFYSLHPMGVSDDNTLLAFAVDTVGRRRYTLYIKNLMNNSILDVHIQDISGFAWAADNQTFFYGKKDPETLRTYQIFKHRLQSPEAEDPLVYEEKDNTFSCSVSRTKSRNYIFIASYSTLSSEYWFLPSGQPENDFQVFLPRESKHEYFLDHYENDFYIRTNWEAKNFRLMKTPVHQTAKTHWEEVIPNRETVLLEDVEIFQKFLVLEERKEGLVNLNIRPWDAPDTAHYLDFGEPAYVAYISINPEFDTDWLRFGYTSMTTPNSTFDYHMHSREKILRKQQEVVGGYDANAYQAERLMATAPDGVQIPISLVYKKGLRKDGQNPLVLYGYGAYGASMDPYFSAVRLSLLDRGFVFAIAHIRGGEEMGRHWYEDGKMFKKKNTFIDFIACAEHLIQEKFTTSSHLFGLGEVLEDYSSVLCSICVRTYSKEPLLRYLLWM